MESAVPAAADFDAHLRRGFAEGEYAARCEQMQRRMAAAGVDALLLTTPANVRYFSGFFTQFWHSPTRPWFVVVPAAGKPIAVIPEIGAAGMADTWVEDIRCWSSPHPSDDGVSLLADTLRSLRVRRLGMTWGRQSTVRMPINDVRKLEDKLRPAKIVDAAGIMHEQRMVKSPAEIAKIAHCCTIVGDAFAALKIGVGMSERQLCRQLRMDIIARGGDESPYLIAASGKGGYNTIIMGPGEREMCAGDILMMDTGSVFDGYFCDFDRNFAVGEAGREARRAHEILHHSVAAGFAAAKPGAVAAEVWRAMNNILSPAAVGQNAVGRLGHSIGMQLTEPPSFSADERTPLAAGMVMTLEPSLHYLPGKQMVLEENIIITDDGAEWLTHRAAAELAVV